ncbi:helix-turn-helix domain-containing protein [Phenylobacterium deserti]|uniref:HTH luxR-type domain-containing protein n=1 Tax=Phenylobacterium deserti TaxID=1914756 RepID=A0A328AE66_9CAUL|nr:helix-turn-helix transcriptional regulator [Phenylobacterium deserti]RAK52777.1 hypothetical protein DJ018_11360 [Phenylobacterium deserti]
MASSFLAVWVDAVSGSFAMSIVDDRGDRSASLADAARLARLVTDRQRACLEWAEKGKSASDISVILGISPRTVEGHLAKACALLGVRTRVQAVVRARKLGLIGDAADDP